MKKQTHIVVAVVVSENQVLPLPHKDFARTMPELIGRLIYCVVDQNGGCCWWSFDRNEANVKCDSIIENGVYEQWMGYVRRIRDMSNYAAALYLRDLFKRLSK